MHMTSRERILTALNHQEPDRVPIHDGPWRATIARWHKEGLPESVTPAEYFGYEMVFTGCDLSPRFPIETLEETEDYIVQKTAKGGVIRNFHDLASTPEQIDHPIKSKKDWPPIEDRLHADRARVEWDSMRAQLEEVRSQGKFSLFVGAYGYDTLQGYMRSEQLLMAMATEPDWVREMIIKLATLTVDMARMIIAEGIEFDSFWCGNDMGYRNALLFSPETYRRTHKEADQMVVSFFHEHGKPVFLHSDGNINELLPDLIDAGFDCIHPLEVKAGMDLRKLKETYGDRLAFWGGIDTRAMAAEDPALIEREIAAKFEAAKVGGGYIYHSDHSVPPNVSFQQYRRVMDLVRTYGQY